MTVQVVAPHPLSLISMHHGRVAIALNEVSILDPRGAIRVLSTLSLLQTLASTAEKCYLGACMHLVRFILVALLRFHLYLVLNFPLKFTGLRVFFRQLNTRASRATSS